jgi:hypothetical protein
VLLLGLAGGAQAGLTINSATVGGGSSITVYTDSTFSVSYQVTVTGGSSEVRGTEWRISTSAPGGTTCADSSPNSPNDTNGTYTTGFTATAPSTAGTYNLYLIANNRDNCSGGTSSAVYTLSNAITVVAPPPEVVSINRADFDPTYASTSVTWTVTFSRSVTGVGVGDFALTQSGGAAGASITSVSGSGTTYTVTANTGTASTGSVRLDLIDDDSIIASDNQKLGGTGTGNGTFSGQAYTLIPKFCSTVSSDIFCDDFERSNADSIGNGWTITPVSASSCSGVTGNTGCAGIDRDIPPFDLYDRPHATNTRSMFTRWSAVYVQSPTVDLSAHTGAILKFWMRRGSDTFSECPEASGENYLVQFWDGAAWQTLAQYPSAPSAGLCGDGEVYQPEIQLPASALHSGFKMRFYQPSGSGSSGWGGAADVKGYDYWHMDNVEIIDSPASSFIGSFCDNFESGLSRWSISAEGAPASATIGDARIGSSAYSSSSHELDMRWGYVAASTFKTDLTGINGNITYWVKSGSGADWDPESGEDLVVEYMDSSGGWTNLATYLGSAAGGSTYNASHALPANAKHANFRLRFRMLGGSGYDYDYWHIDDVCVGSGLANADLSITKTHSGTFLPGSNVTYVLTGKNNGPGTLSGSMQIVDTLPSSLSLISATGSGWGCSANGQVVTCTWNGNLASGASPPVVTIVASLSATATGSVTNTATISGTVNETNSANNTVTDVANIAAATLIAEYHLEELAWHGTSGELDEVAGYAGGPYDGTATGSSYPTASTTSPAIPGSTGTCGYATLSGPIANGGAFTVTGLPVSTTSGAKTSVAFWMYWDGTDDSIPFGWNRYALLFKGGYFGFTTGNSSDIYGIASTGLANGWHHIAAVFTNGDVASNILYLDGVLQTLSQLQGTANNANATVNSSMVIGGWGYDSNHRFSGRLDEVLLYKNVVSATDVSANYQATHTCPVTVDHYELSLAQHSINCVPTTVTVTACTNSTSNPCDSPSAAVNGYTATLATSGGSLGASPVTFNASGVATTTLSYPAAADGATVTVTLSGEQITAAHARKCCPDGINCVAQDSCSTTFNKTGFIFSSAKDGTVATIPTQVAGTSSGTYYLRAVKTNDDTSHTCGGAFSGAQTVGFAYECNNPATCYGADLMSINGGTATTISRNNNGGVSGVYSYTSVPLTFDANGNAPFTFIYSDVGLIKLLVNKTLTASASTTAATLSGASNAFVVKPAGFVLSNIKQTASPNLVNPAAADASGAKFVMAGESFSATVTAVTSTGSTAYSYGRESTAEGVKLSGALVSGLGLAQNPGISNNTGFGSFTNGVATGTGFAWGEVGIITLTPSVADGDYLGEGDVTGTTSGNVGRFYPHHFEVTGSVISRSDLQTMEAQTTPYTYMGEPQKVTLTVTAHNAADGATQNYAGNFAKLDATTLGTGANWFNTGCAVGTQCMGLGAMNPGASSGTGLSGRLSVSTGPGNPSSSWVSGVGTFSAHIVLSRNSTPDGPYGTLKFGAAPQDSDGVVLPSPSSSDTHKMDFDATEGNTLASNPDSTNERRLLFTTKGYFGRLWLGNAYGSDQKSLSVPYETQYWNGFVFVRNTADSLVPFALGNVSLNTVLGTPPTLTLGSFASGSGTLGLSAPGVPGTVDVYVNLGSTGSQANCPGYAVGTSAGRTYLSGKWCGSNYDRDPVSRATFGVQAGKRGPIYIREHF